MYQKPSSQSSRYKLGKNSFPALLKTAEGEFLESGQASVSIETRSVDFASDFVPLFTMGTPLQIVRTYGKQEIHQFRGEVYLSSEKYLRLTSVEDTLLEGSERAYLFPAELPASVRLVGAASPEDTKPRLFHRKTTAPVQEVFDVTVTLIALESLEFVAAEELPDADSIELSMDSPILLNRIPLTVKRMLRFGQGGVSYSCSFVSLPESVQTEWETYIRELHRKTNKLF